MPFLSPPSLAGPKYREPEMDSATYALGLQSRLPLQYITLSHFPASSSSPPQYVIQPHIFSYHLFPFPKANQGPIFPNILLPNDQLAPWRDG